MSNKKVSKISKKWLVLRFNSTEDTLKLKRTQLILNYDGCHNPFPACWQEQTLPHNHRLQQWFEAVNHQREVETQLRYQQKQIIFFNSWILIANASMYANSTEESSGTTQTPDTVYNIICSGIMLLLRLFFIEIGVSINCPFCDALEINWAKI